jgi:actin-related protein
MIGSSTVVLDCGSGNTKMGWGHQTIPELIYPTVVGRPMLRKKTTVDGIEIKVSTIPENSLKIRTLWSEKKLLKRERCLI